MEAQLTIIIPVLNRAESLTNTLASVLTASQRVPVSLILVDNGSSDASLDLCRKFAGQQLPETLSVTVLSEPVKGASIARNSGLSACQTEWVYFFDSDDFMSDDFCEIILNQLCEVGCELDVLAVPVMMTVSGRQQVRAYEPSGRPEAHILNNMLCTVSMVFRTSWLRSIGGWNEELTTWDDWELGTRALLSKPRLCWFTKKAFHQIMVHSDSQTGESFSNTLKPIILATEAVLKDVCENDRLSDSERKQCLMALFYRSHIMAGKLSCEGSREGEQAFKDIAKAAVPNPSALNAFMGWLLEHYTAIGGRGAWLIALSCL